MTSNYQEICAENQKRYGTDIGRIGPMLLADRYDDRTHFIFELLQNAEDALGRRLAWQGSRAVAFNLSAQSLKLSHFGKPFDDADVRGVCGIAQSTKDFTAIGCFGIGFKSVYTFTERPEIHSGSEDFGIENFVLPVKVDRNIRSDDETTIELPLRATDTLAHSDILDGLKRLGANALLFLRHIEEITWQAPDGSTGIYMRSKPEPLGSTAQRITVIGHESGKPELDQNWLVFHREVTIDGSTKTGRVEIAFNIVPINDDSERRWSIQPVADSPLVVYFPTVVSTNLGFLVQGPYRTTPSRDNVPKGDAWNQFLVKETATLLVEALRTLRDDAMLDTSALRCLPLDRSKFPDQSMFAPLFEAVRYALLTEPLLPRFEGGYVAGRDAKLARTQELRELFKLNQIRTLFGNMDVSWLSSDITQNLTPELRQYLIHELSVAEITPEAILQKLGKTFLEAQSDNWMLHFYDFLSDQPALRRRLDTIPLIRLNDGSHVLASKNGRSLAFLPCSIETGFPTMRIEVCATLKVRSFLTALGITEPDPVDDVIRNILPKYSAVNADFEITDESYIVDIEKIKKAFSTDSKNQRDKLIAALREAPFVMAIDAGTDAKYMAMPRELYLATDRLKHMFSGILNVLLIDDSFPCLRGENSRELLEACGAVRYPRLIETLNTLSDVERTEWRKQARHPETSGRTDRVRDWTLYGFDALLKALPTLDHEARKERSRLIWDSLGDLEERRGQSFFEGVYTWTHHGPQTIDIPSAFIRQLNRAAWVPDAQGDLQQSGNIVFETLGWKPNPFLLSKIAFKPAIIELLAKEAGIDSAILDWLKKNGVTSEAEFKARLGIPELVTEPLILGDQPSGDVYSDVSDLYGDLPHIPSGTYDPNDGDDVLVGGLLNGGHGGNGRSTNTGGAHRGTNGINGNTDGNKSGNRPVKGDDKQRNRTPGSNGGRPFISYVGIHATDEENDPDGIDQATRMKLEELAIQKILAMEPKLNRTPAFNPGFDLFEKNTSDQPTRWVEVKAMTGSLRDRPVGLSHTQFEFARTHGTSFWLYVVERASNPEDFRILRIQNPVAHARTFTFDHGWEEIETELNMI